MRRRFGGHVGLCAVLLVSLGGSAAAWVGTAGTRHPSAPRHHRTPQRPPARTIGRSEVVTPLPAGAPLFSPTSIWNASVPTAAPLSANSATLSVALSSEVYREVLGDLGPWINTDRFSVPVYTVGVAVPAVHVTLDNHNTWLQRDFRAVPIPSGAHSAGGGDGTLVIYQPSRDTLWEFWLAHRRRDGWHAAWGGKLTHVSTNPGYFPGAYGGSGSGLALLGGLLTVHDLQSGLINHALAIGIPNTAWGRPTAPAPRSDGRTWGPAAIPEGTHFRIDPNLDLSKLHLSPLGLMIARAAQRYGMVVRETSGSVVFYAEDPTTMSSNPYGHIFGGATPSTLLRGFPWDRLQVVAPTGS